MINLADHVMLYVHFFNRNSVFHSLKDGNLLLISNVLNDCLHSLAFFFTNVMYEICSFKSSVSDISAKCFNFIFVLGLGCLFELAILKERSFGYQHTPLTVLLKLQSSREFGVRKPSKTEKLTLVRTSDV